ncbi:hypothetical protein [Streptantibioticus ferralitis]|uniref:Uncharacterized protein n=1 Tax=Streptantibioticus ferralitis TaxID=236510 RepID=A0ABT5YYM9_9ACTN|nr:hypothetical protein [Streptantibioticus ferralitis]MDF2256701.1 hypothetical protein [Streptantibioticus ferralitis]
MASTRGPWCRVHGSRIRAGDTPSANGAALTGCARSGGLRSGVSRSTGHGFIDLCRGCGALLRSCVCGQPHYLHPREKDLWPGLWRREHMANVGLPNPYWPGEVEDRISALRW